MNVPVHGCLDARMTKQLLQHLGLYSTLNRSGGVGVPQSVHAESIDPGLVTQLV